MQPKSADSVTVLLLPAKIDQVPIICQTEFVFPAYINAENIQCKTGVGGINGSKDVKENLHFKECPEGITQCMKTGIKLDGEFSFDQLILIFEK